MRILLAVLLINIESAIKDFEVYLKLEKSLSENSVEAYLSDISKFIDFLDNNKITIHPEKVDLDTLRKFIHWINNLGMSARTQARVISGIKSFYKFLLLEEKIETDPSALLEGPRLGMKLPDVLSVEEIDAIIAFIKSLL